MIEPSESARRIASTLQRFGVTLDSELAGQGPNALVAKKGMGLAMMPFVERLREELESSEIPEKTIRLVNLRVKQLEEVATELASLPASDRFEPPELAMLATFVDISVYMLGIGVGKEYRAVSP